MISILEKSKFVNIIVSVAIKKGQKYILVRETKKEIKGLWNFPSGKVEFGEGLFSAAKREVKEETGFDCEITKLTGIYFFYWEDMPGLSIRFNFLGKITSYKQNTLANDVSETSWFNMKEIEELDKNNQLRGKATINQYKDLKRGKNYPSAIISEI